MTENIVETATFGAGCFWCVEALFQNLKGVKKVESGYCGGQSHNPTYQEVCAGRSGHAEVIHITFDPGIISFKILLEVFWRSHDPTSLNRQGADSGEQYRSVIFYHSDDQRKIAQDSLRKTDESGLWPNPIVTEISLFTKFYKAEDYHQNYYNNNSGQPYCSMWIKPKLQELYKLFGYLLKDRG